MSIEIPALQVANAVVTVGAGRGFVMNLGGHVGRVVVTAAHCLPHFPPAIGAISYTEERTYASLLGRLDEEPTIWAGCIFADPIADIAVLAGPDSQSLFDESDAFEAFIEQCGTFSIGAPPVVSWDDALRLPGWVLSLDGIWTACRVRPGEALYVLDAPVVSGMSGSPIVIDGAAVGIVNNSDSDKPDRQRGRGPQARLVRCLPAWMVEALRQPEG